MQLKLLPIVVLATAAFADEYTLAALKQIKQATVDFNNTLAEWNGGYLTAVSILKQSRDLINTLNAASSPPTGIKTIALRSSDIEQEALDVAQRLARDVGETVNTAISAKPKFEAIPAIGKPIAWRVFKRLHTAALGLGGVFSLTASDERQEEAQAIVKQIDNDFARGLAAFSSMGD